MNIMLTEEQIEELKAYKWGKNHDHDTFYLADISREKFAEFTGFDLVKLYDLKASNISIGWDIIYGRPGTDTTYPEHYYIQYVVCVRGEDWGESSKVWNTGYFINGFDFMGLYTKEEEKTEDLSEEEVIKKLSSALTLATDNLDIDKIIDLIDNNFADVSNRMRENFSESLEVNDIGECLKEDIARDWIEQNPDDAYDRAVDNMYSSDIRDKIIDYINDNLN